MHMDVDAFAAGLIARRPAPTREVTQEEIDSDRWDPMAWRLERTRGVLERRTDVEFRNATVSRPEVQGWVDRFVEDPTDCPPLLHVGGLGTGKTTEAYAALWAAVLGREAKLHTIRWQAVTHPQLNDLTRPKPDESHHDWYWKLERADLLLVDDFAASRISDWADDVLLRIVDYRWANHLPMIVTTNLAPDKISRATANVAVGERIASRLSGAVLVRFTGPDRRKAGGAR